MLILIYVYIRHTFTSRVLIVPETSYTSVTLVSSDTGLTGTATCVNITLGIGRGRSTVTVSTTSILIYINIRHTFTSRVLIVPETSYTSVTLVTSDTWLTGTATCVNITLGIGGGRSTVTVSTTSIANEFYQLPLILTAACLSHGMCLYQVILTLHFLNGVVNDAESTQKIDHYVILASLKSESTW